MALDVRYSVLTGMLEPGADERVAAVLEALGSGGCAYTHVEMVNAFVTDALGRVLAAALATNGSITHLNLESNALSSGSLEAFAEALKANGTLRELKLANQHIAFSQQAEMALAGAGRKIAGGVGTTRAKARAATKSIACVLFLDLI